MIDPLSPAGLMQSPGPFATVADAFNAAQAIIEQSWTGPELAPDRAELLRRFARYGHSHGAWDDAHGYVEGSFARIVEAALGDEPALPSVKTEPTFLCGTEFASLAAELAFFRERDLPLEPVQIEVCLGPGELLIFDNLAFAHGRIGARRPGELRQRIFGHRGLSVSAQLDVRDRVLDAFTTPARQRRARRRGVAV